MSKDDPTRKIVRQTARRGGTPVSRRIRGRITADTRQSWPDEFFKLCGSISDRSFRRPAQLSFGQDTRRETL